MASALHAQIAAVHRVPVGPGPVLAITVPASATDQRAGERLLLSCPGEVGAPRELLRTEPGCEAALVERLDRQHLLLVTGQNMMFPSQVFVVETAAGTCRELDLPCIGLMAWGERVVGADYRCVGVADWRTGVPAWRWSDCDLRDLQWVGDAVFGIGADRLWRLDLTDGSRAPFGPPIQRAEVGRLIVAPDARRYTIGKLSPKAEPAVRWPCTPDGPFAELSAAARYVRFGNIEVRDIATGKLLRSIDDVAVRGSRLLSEGPRPAAPWLDENRVLVTRLRQQGGFDCLVPVAVNLATGEEWDLDDEAARWPANDGLLWECVGMRWRRGLSAAWAEPRVEHMPSPDGAWVASLTPIGTASAVEIESTATGEQRRLGTFEVLGLRWLPAR